ncbi:MAG: hypothetical protein A2351_02425 [Omnitrophica bacterium RIFOXYB12_FULL_50_7]|nr:MAG: hypothetical protein A2351_02425 [Omnitrophica bacterium RIFOXYB12_FULL_50_7]
MACEGGVLLGTLRRFFYPFKIGGNIRAMVQYRLTKTQEELGGPNTYQFPRNGNWGSPSRPLLKRSKRLGLRREKVAQKGD